MKTVLNELKNNKIVKVFLVVIVVLILIFIGIEIYFGIKGRRIKSYSKLENTLEIAGKKYFNDNNDMLPKEIGSTVSVDDSTLTKDGYLKSLSNIAPKGVTCSGEVTVKNVNGNYAYYANLDCQDKYKSELLVNHILANEVVVNSSNGLYSYGNEYVYRGENVNNYIEFAGRLYRIVSINEDKSLNIVADSRIKGVQKPNWDDRYNLEKKDNRGINDYSVSRLKEFLEGFLNDSEYFSDKDKTKLMTQSLCIGKVNIGDGLKRKAECSSTLDNQYIGLLTASEYSFASIDANCKKIGDGSCENYNYLNDMDTSWWLLTGLSINSYRVLEVLYDGSIYDVNASSSAYARETLRLTDLLGYKSGNGSADAPYVIK